MPILQSPQLIKSFPEAARAAYKSIKSSKWEHIPFEDNENIHLYWCSACNAYHKMNYILGHRVSYRSLVVIVYSIDEDGDRDLIGEFDTDKPEDRKTLENYDRFARLESWRKYYHNINLGSTDYLNVLSPKMVETVRWMADLANFNENIVHLVGAKAVGTTLYHAMGSLPSPVINFLHIDPKNRFLMRPIIGKFKNLEQIHKGGDDYEVGPLKNDIQTIFFNVNIPLPFDKIRIELNKAAMMAIQTIDEPQNQRPRV